MRIRIAVAGLLLALGSGTLSHAQTDTSIVGWYNGDWRSGIPGQSNWYVNSTQYARYYDDFVVPEGGWTITAVFSNNSLNNVPAITQASWEIRSGVSIGNAGTPVAGDLSPATQTANRTGGDYRIQVSGLNVKLPPGRYWLSVAPFTTQNGAYLHPTTGTNAVGDPPGNNGLAFNSGFMPVELTGQGLVAKDFSQGVLILPPWMQPSAPWQSDLAFLAYEMPRRHSIPFPGISLADFNAKIADLSARVPKISDAEIRTGLQAIVASIAASHTDVGWPGSTPFRYLPLTFYWFDEGIYVTDASPGYFNLLGGKVVWVGKVGVEEATTRLATLVSNENTQWPKYKIPRDFLPNTDFLFGTGIADSTDSVPIAVQVASGDIVVATVQAGARGGYRYSASQGTLPLARQHTDWHYWATPTDNGATVYFQYNSCTEDARLASADFIPQLDLMLAQDGVQRVVVDMRNNGGGFVSILNPWIDRIKTSKFNQRGRLYVIVGRNTFSAAMDATDRFHDETAATFVGEPTGAQPRFLYRISDFSLPYFGITVSYSSGPRLTPQYGPSLVPDIQTPVSFQDYMNGFDPALDAILKLPLP